MAPTASQRLALSDDEFEDLDELDSDDDEEEYDDDGPASRAPTGGAGARAGAKAKKGILTGALKAPRNVMFNCKQLYGEFDHRS